ncbi:MAG: ComEA family DNA-binding protein [Candidatus Eiseniibacteriota bacterium]
MKTSKLVLAALALGFVVPVLAMADDTMPQSTTPPATSAQPAHHEKSAKPAKPHVNLNTGTKEQLMAIPGLDDATADKIIAARPFKSKNELMEKNILTKDQYNKISSMVTTEAHKSSSHSSSKSSTKK